jgi:hypothetical protein
MVYPLTVQDTEIVPTVAGIWPIPICGVIPERFVINYSSGAPGSYMYLTGRSFSGDSEVNVSIDNYDLGGVIPDSNGEIFFLLLTTGADVGVCVVRIQKGSEFATISFRLVASQPLRPQEGAGPLFDVPSGISLSELNLLPLIRSG